ncbi:MAG: cysteine--tRNA ligase [Candidatus Epulonipiscioides saccharophilum]|nr:MAG: cysteine--tRNA ligase [Epulopiscium sp. AS2M-Bin001]
MKVYNTLTKKKEEFIPLSTDEVKMYVCGPTVYNLIHIGNARPIVVFDAFRRYLIDQGYKVNFVQNFTDVDDKIIKKANEQGKDTSEIVDFYIKETLQDMENLNVLPATANPRVTNEMDEIIAMIEQLIEKGYAYAVCGSVFFSTDKFKDYGKLSKKVLEELEAGARIEIDNIKAHPMDFVLWKPKKDGEPYWISPWGKGRPGWHIECSAMSKKYLGDQIDIHAGGEDLIFPHHENEIAQSEAVNGKHYSKYWLHNSFLNIDNKKMSKSLGNFMLLRDVGEEFGYDTVRFFMLAAHYRSPLNFSDKLMESAKASLLRIKNCSEDLNFVLDHLKNESKNISTEFTQDEENLLTQIDSYNTRFYTALDDDFNSADAISIIFELVKTINSYIKTGKNKTLLLTFKETFDHFNDVLGLLYETEIKASSLTDEEILNYIAKRSAAKKNKDFATADQIRTFLEQNNIQIKDTREGVQFKRV